MKYYVSENEIALNSEKDAFEIAHILLENDYVVMISKEEDLTVINWEYSKWANRNDMIFRSREEYEWEEYEETKADENENQGECYND